MGEKSNISWTDSTFNPVIGCMKVSAGCDLCYAETLMDKRYHRVQWGQRKTDDTVPSVGTRIRTSPDNWRKPITWNKHYAAFQAEHGHRQRVFCASLSDVFDNQWLPEWRAELFDMIGNTPNLDWLLLTKRPENVENLSYDLWPMGAPENVWLGTTAENQDAYDKRWPIMSRIPARVKFISYEPALGPLDIIRDHTSVPDWLICGGESSVGFRPMDMAWAARIMQDCELQEVPFFMKQVSGVKPRDEQIPTALMRRQFPRIEHAS